MTEKTTGYILLVIGVLIMLSAAFSIIFVFTKRTPPVQLFNYKGISIDPAQFAPETPGLSSIPGMQGLNLPQKSTSPKPMEIISGDMLNTSANIFAHVALMGFLLTLGFNLASLGTNLLRPIIVKTPHGEIAAEAQS